MASPSPGISIAGAGWAGTVHALAAAGTGRTRVRAVASRDPGRAAEVAALVDADVVTYAELPVRDGVVVIATPPTSHHGLARPLIERGVPLLIEKPLCATLAEADDLIAAATASGATVGYAENLLFAPVVIEAMRRIAALGPLRHLELRCCQPPPDWGHFIEPLTAGGVLYDLGAHPLALALAITSASGQSPVAISAELSSQRLDGADDHARVTLHHDVLATHIECSWVAPDVSWTLQAASEAGTVVVELNPTITLEHNGEPVPIAEPNRGLADPALESFGYVGQLNGLLDVLTGRGGTVCPLGFARDVLAVTCAAYRSAGGGGAPVPLPYDGPRDVTPLELWRGPS